MQQKNYTILNDAILVWRKEKKEYDEKALAYKKGKFKLFGIHPLFYLLSFVVMFYFAFRNPIGSNNRTDAVAAQHSPTAKDFTLYQKPSKKSKVLFRCKDAVKVRILEETTYYFKVAFSHKEVDFEGFTAKHNVRK